MPIFSHAHSDTKPLTATLLSMTIQPVPYPPSGCVKSLSLQLRYKDIVQNSVECFAQVQVEYISASSLIHQCCNPVVESH